MTNRFVIGGVRIDVVFKDIKNVHLSVYPPKGRVLLTAPSRTSLDSLRLFAIDRLVWIRKQQARLRAQEREPAREYVERESHMLWGRRYLLRLSEAPRANVAISGRAIQLRVPKGAALLKRRELLTEWYRAELRLRAGPLIEKWSNHLNVNVDKFFIQQMKTKWGSSNPSRRSIRLNLELAKCSPECLDYVVLHEIAHFIAPDHSKRFIALLDRSLPGWRVVRDRLNAHPLAPIEMPRIVERRRAS